MQPATLISVPEYLATTFRPDQDMIEGHLIERNRGEYDHANLQGELVRWFRNHQREWNIRALPEQRVQVKHDRVRIPDVCIVARDRPFEQIITHAPLLCIEVLSKDDTLSGMRERIGDYLELGVVNIWLLDPGTRRAYIRDRGGLHEPSGGVLQVPGTRVSLGLETLFAELDSERR